MNHCCINLLIVMFSSQLYQSGRDENAKIDAHSEDLFIDYVFELASDHMRVASGRLDLDATDTVSVKLVKGLLCNIIQAKILSPNNSCIIFQLRKKYMLLRGISDSIITKNSDSNAQHDTVSLVLRETFWSIFDVPLQAIKSLLRITNIYPTGYAPIVDGYAEKAFLPSAKKASRPLAPSSENFVVPVIMHLSDTPLADRSFNLLSLLLQNRRYSLHLPPVPFPR